MKISINKAILWLILFLVSTMFFLNKMNGQDHLQQYKIGEKFSMWYNVPAFQKRATTEFHMMQINENGFEVSVTDTFSAGSTKFWGIQYIPNSRCIDSVIAGSCHPLEPSDAAMIFTGLKKKNAGYYTSMMKVVPLIGYDSLYVFQVKSGTAKPFDQPGMIFVDARTNFVLYTYDKPVGKAVHGIQVYLGDPSNKPWDDLLWYLDRFNEMLAYKAKKDSK